MVSFTVNLCDLNRCDFSFFAWGNIKKHYSIHNEMPNMEVKIIDLLRIKYVEAQMLFPYFECIPNAEQLIAGLCIDLLEHCLSRFVDVNFGHFSLVKEDAIIAISKLILQGERFSKTFDHNLAVLHTGNTEISNLCVMLHNFIKGINFNDTYYEIQPDARSFINEMIYVYPYIVNFINEYCIKQLYKINGIHYDLSFKKPTTRLEHFTNAWAAYITIDNEIKKDIAHASIWAKNIINAIDKQYNIDVGFDYENGNRGIITLNGKCKLVGIPMEKSSEAIVISVCELLSRTKRMGMIDNIIPVSEDYILHMAINNASNDILKYMDI